MMARSHTARRAVIRSRRGCRALPRPALRGAAGGSPSIQNWLPFMKTILSLALLTAMSTAALAQADTCAAYLRAQAEMKAALRSAGTAVPPVDPMDAKIEAYCTRNPNAPLAEAMQKALAE